ncbi:hypothetical protein KI387_040564, partial [Taxus chinensis]
AMDTKVSANFLQWGNARKKFLFVMTAAIARGSSLIPIESIPVSDVSHKGEANCSLSPISVIPTHVSHSSEVGTSNSGTIHGNLCQKKETSRLRAWRQAMKAGFAKETHIIYAGRNRETSMEDTITDTEALDMPLQSRGIDADMMGISEPTSSFRDRSCKRPRGTITDTEAQDIDADTMGFRYMGSSEPTSSFRDWSCKRPRTDRIKIGNYSSEIQMENLESQKESFAALNVLADVAVCILEHSLPYSSRRWEMLCPTEAELFISLCPEFHSQAHELLPCNSEDLFTCQLGSPVRSLKRQLNEVVDGAFVERDQSLFKN